MIGSAGPMTSLSDSKLDAAEKRRAVRELAAFFGLAFAITWGLAGFVLLFRPQFEAVFGPIVSLTKSWPFYVAACAPTISAILLAALFGGLNGLKVLFLGLVRPARFLWIMASILTLPAAYFFWGIGERLVFGGASNAINIHALLVSAPLLISTTPIVLIDPGPWGEETGWRGFALPRLLVRFSPVTAAVILGVFWSCWHLPAFLASGLAQSHFNFGWFLVRDVSLSIFMTWIYLNANRNFILAGFVPHLLNNIAFDVHAVQGVETDAIVIFSLALLAIAVSGPSLRGRWFRRTALR